MIFKPSRGCFERLAFHVLEHKVLGGSQAETVRNSAHSVQTTISARLAPNGTTSEGGEHRIRMRALDHEFADVAGKLTYYRLIAVANNASLGFQIAKYPGFELGFDRWLPRVLSADLDQRCDDTVCTDEHKEGDQ